MHHAGSPRSAQLPLTLIAPALPQKRRQGTDTDTGADFDCTRPASLTLTQPLTLLEPAPVTTPPPGAAAGKPRGFAFLAYEDQRSTVLAVDNLSGARIAGRVVRVEHVDNYKKKKAEVCIACMHARAKRACV